MNTNKEWVKDTMALLEDLEKRKQLLHDKYEQLGNDLMDLEQKIALGHELVSEYMNKYNITSITPENIKLDANKSYPDMLIKIAKDSNGILNLSDAVEILFKENIGKNKKAIQHNIYNAIARLEGHFVRIKRGQYRFTNNIQTSSKKKERSGIREAIKELKEKNPQLTKNEVLNHLIKTNFDFKGRKPANAVNIVWAKLGYYKEGKQQSLPGVR